MRISDWSSTCALPISSIVSPSTSATPPPKRRTICASSVASSSTGQRPCASHSASNLNACGVWIRYRPSRATISPRVVRSEEHTSELQSLMQISYAVFCLKKKKDVDDTEMKQTHTHTHWEEQRHGEGQL